MASRSRSRERYRSRSPRSRSRSGSRAPMSDYSQSPGRRRRVDSRSPSRSRSRSPVGSRNGRGKSRTRSRSRSRSRERSESPLKSTKIVVERLTKNINEDHLREIFGQFGPIDDLDLPMNRQFNTNRGTAYILFVNEGDAEAAVAHMHEAQVDGAVINVSIVLPRRKLSPPPPLARRGANIDPRNPLPGMRSLGGPPSAPSYASARGFPGGPAARRGGGRSPLQGGQYGPRSDTYRPRTVSRSRSPTRSPAVVPPPSRSGAGGGGGGGARYRSRSNSYSSRSRSRTPPRRRGGGGGGRRHDDDFGPRRRSPSRSSYESFRDRDRSRSRSRGRDPRGHR